MGTKFAHVLNGTLQNVTKMKSKTVEVSLNQSVTESPPTNAVPSTQGRSSSVANISNIVDVNAAPSSKSGWYFVRRSVVGGGVG